MEANLQQVLERIANALERQNQLLKNKEKRQMKLDRLELESKKVVLKESKAVKASPRIRKEG